VPAEFVLFNELRDELRKLLLEPDRWTTTGFGTVLVVIVVVVGFCATTDLVGACLTGTEATALVPPDFWTVCCCGGDDDDGVLKLLVRFGNSVFLVTAAVGLANDFGSFDFLVATVFVTVPGPLLLLFVVSLLPLLSALAIVFGTGFSVSKLPDDVS